MTLGNCRNIILPGTWESIKYFGVDAYVNGGCGGDGDDDDDDDDDDNDKKESRLRLRYMSVQSTWYMKMLL